jgi:hypothetical protein
LHSDWPCRGVPFLIGILAIFVSFLAGMLPVSRRGFAPPDASTKRVWCKPSLSALDPLAVRHWGNYRVQCVVDPQQSNCRLCHASEIFNERSCRARWCRRMLYADCVGVSRRSYCLPVANHARTQPRTR